jgi:plastocyanin
MHRALLSLLTFGMLALTTTSAVLAQADSTINMVGVAFDQTEVDISAGQTVLWNNPSGLVHTVTADDSSFDSGDIPSSGTYSRTFDAPGTYAYYCQYHGDVGGVGMAGVIVVQ